MSQIHPKFINQKLWMAFRHPLTGDRYHSEGESAGEGGVPAAGHVMHRIRIECDLSVGSPNDKPRIKCVQVS